MRLRILSDLHLECFDKGLELPNVDADVVILAGDIDKHHYGVGWARQQFADTPILYVPGNHEFYGSVMEELREKLSVEAKRYDIELLDNRAVTIDGVRFYGTTLWTDFELYADDPTRLPETFIAKAQSVMPDFTVITEPKGQVFTPQASQQLHDSALAWLQEELALPFGGRKVVISHHAPLRSCIPEQYSGDDLSPAFASHLPSLMGKMDLSPAFASHLPSLMGKMDLWVHGHVHEPVDTLVSGTRVIANPGGYPGEFKPELFRPDLIVTV